MAKREWFKWTFEIEVCRLWIEDGFNPDAETIKNALRSTFLSCATGPEVRVKMIREHDQREVLEAQGFEGESLKAELKKPRTAIDKD